MTNFTQRTSGLFVPDHIVEKSSETLPTPALEKQALPYPPGPNDLGIIDPKSENWEVQLHSLTSRVLTDRHLQNIDRHSAHIFRKLFIAASTDVLKSDLPSVWSEVIDTLDDTLLVWDCPEHLILNLEARNALDPETSRLLRNMESTNLSILLARCRLILGNAIEEALASAKTPATTGKLAFRRKSKTMSVSTGVKVFAISEIVRGLNVLEQLDEKTRPQVQKALNTAKTDNGKRSLPDVQKAIVNLDQLERNFKNLIDPIEHLKTELVLASTMGSEKYRISPILLLGDPGIGKTYLALQLANALGVPMEKISAGTAQGGFQLTGSHPSWRQAMSGSVFNLLAEGPSASPVLIVDEVDKIGDSGPFPIMPALLDLLEHNTAKTFRDEFVGMQFDASRLVIVMTANTREAIPAPLLSRTTLFEIPCPTPEQRQRIIETEFAELVRNTGKRFNLDAAAAADLATQTSIDLRQTRRAVVEAFAKTIARGGKTVVPKIPVSHNARCSIGFVGR